MIVIECLLGVIAITLLIPASVLFFQVLLASFGQLKQPVDMQRACSVAVLIPAHNESAGIVATLASLQPQLTAADRLVVVADNCSDDTAQIAQAHGAEVIVRTNETQRGKGFALDFGLRHIAKNPCDVLVIVDADCIVEPQSLKKLAASALQYDRPVQALYLMLNQAPSSLKSKIAEFAWRVRNWVRPLGFAKLGLPCQLMGTGMAFPWKSIVNVDLANGNIVEDMKLGIDFALAGKAPMFYPEAKVTSYFPLTSEVQKGQSKRWEHGHLAMILSEAPKLLVKGITRLSLSTTAMALDLSIPPLALLVAFIVGFTGLLGVTYWMFGIAMMAFQISLLSIVVLTLAILLAWWGWGKQILSLSSMLFIPVYILLKIPNYFSFIFKRQSTWNKTKREQE
jgi:cellulose synthase/poly-beta-1,6-N-acetylglucosamine synthase-like glycosyltransferase